MSTLDLDILEYREKKSAKSQIELNKTDFTNVLLMI
jgi:hypothetical protein